MGLFQCPVTAASFPRERDEEAVIRKKTRAVRLRS